MAKAKTKSFILEFKLKTNNEHLNVLDKRFEIARIMYNTTLKYAKKQLKKMRENKAYNRLLNQHINTSNEKEKKSCSELLTSVRLSYGLSEYQLHEYINVQRQMYKKFIDVNTAQKIATTVWKSVESVLFKKGKTLHFKRFGTLSSLEGKDNKMGIKFRLSEPKKYKSYTIKNEDGNKVKKFILVNKSKLNNRLEWLDMIIPIKTRKNDLFTKEALETRKIKYCRIIRKPFKSGYRYYLQLIMEGVPPIKRINSTGEFRCTAYTNNRVGLDIGTSSIAICSTNEVKLLDLALKSSYYDNEIKKIKRKLQRSRWSNN